MPILNKEIAKIELSIAYLRHLIQTGGDGAFLLSRANHTGTQTASTISDFQSAVSSNSTVTANTTSLALKLGQETAATFSAISSRTDLRLVYVVTDETVNNTATLYLYNGTTKIGQILLY